MTDQGRLWELVDQWEKLQRQGYAPTVEQLCANDPQLAEPLRECVQALQSMAWLDEPPSERGRSTVTYSPPTATSVGPVPAANPPTDRPMLGEYILLREIGRGGMGRVYEARHRTMNRPVAVKVLAAPVAKQSQMLSRFHREIQAIARLSHPNIVTAYDAGQCHGIHFLVLELIQGTDLARQVKEQGPFPVGAAIDAVLQTAHGLQYAHAEGIVHRDIKPSNLLVDQTGTVKILDLGLARFDRSILSDDTDTSVGDLTREGGVLGTVDFMAPEQALNTKYADQRADIYGLGCTLYFLLTGQPMYDGETVMERLLAHREQPIPALGAPDRVVPPALETAFQKMVAKRPEDRYQAMSDVIAALETCRAVGPRRPSPALQGIGWLHWRLAAIIMLISLGLGALAALIAGPSQPPPGQAPTESRAADVKPSLPPATPPLDEKRTRNTSLR